MYHGVASGTVTYDVFACLNHDAYIDLRVTNAHCSLSACLHVICMVLQSVRKYLQKCLDEGRTFLLGVAIKSSTLTNGLK
jgi:hypothetical protein